MEAQKEYQLRAEFDDLLSQFKVALLNKLMDNERKYGFGDAWKISDWEEHLQRGLQEHTLKGDPRDVAIYALFAWYHGWRTAPQPNTVESLQEKAGKLDIHQTAAIIALTHSFSSSSEEVAQRSIVAIESILGPIPAPLYALLPRIIQQNANH